MCWEGVLIVPFIQKYMHGNEDKNIKRTDSRYECKFDFLFHPIYVLFFVCAQFLHDKKSFKLHHQNTSFRVLGIKSSIHWNE